MLVTDCTVCISPSIIIIKLYYRLAVTHMRRQIWQLSKLQRLQQRHYTSLLVVYYTPWTFCLLYFIVHWSDSGVFIRLFILYPFEFVHSAICISLILPWVLDIAFFTDAPASLLWTLSSRHKGLERTFLWQMVLVTMGWPAKWISSC